MLDKIIGVRKLIMSLLILVIAVSVVVARGDVPPGLVSVLSFIFGGFVAGNAVEHINDGALARIEAQAPTTENGPTSPAQSGEVQALDQKVDAANGALATIQSAIAMIIEKTGLNKR